MDKDIFAKRLSIKSFKPDDVPQDMVSQLLYVAIAAPNAGIVSPLAFLRRAQ